MRALCIAALLCACTAAAHAQLKAPSVDAAVWRNTTTGAPLKPGVYGRIEVKGTKAPPLIYDQPVTVSGAHAAKNAKPVYLYVPPGQVRKWDRFCTKWQACETPVYFVRVDDSPSRLGRWKLLREQHAGWSPTIMP